MLTPIMARPYLHRLITYAFLIYSFASPVKSFPSPNPNNSPGSYSSPSFNQTSASEMAYPQPAYRSVAYFVVSLLTFVLVIRWERVHCSNSMYTSIHKIEKRIDIAAAALMSRVPGNGIRSGERCPRIKPVMAIITGRRLVLQVHHQSITNDHTELGHLRPQPSATGNSSRQAYPRPVRLCQR